MSAIDNLYRLRIGDYRVIYQVEHKIQLNSESFRQDKFKDELSYRTRVREYRRMSKICLYQAIERTLYY
ncbi:palindromic element RPE3 domain-containing protein [Rickettsia endosymbiont of Orchestes rusci]|uniref:palindromic element RPE3 domain-containing protein n=1 Tax=Rickettsia endosymbiont of Orchestes rusci TaxID=3066250 RepID=UPI00313C41E7